MPHTIVRLLMLFGIVVLAGLTSAGAAPPQQSDPPPPIPPPFRLAEDLPILDQAALICTQRFADPAVDLIQSNSPWRELIARRTISDDMVRSTPRAVAMSEDADGTPSSGDDQDGFGQTIAIDSAAELLYGSLYYQVAAESARADETLRVAIYRGNSTSDANRVGLFSVNTAAAASGWQRFDWELADQTAVAALRSSGSATIMIELRSQSADQSNQAVWVDDLAANVCVSALSITGRITHLAAPDADLTSARLILTREDDSGMTPVAETFPSADGGYRFGGLRALPAGSRYRVWFVNNATEPVLPDDRIGFWAGPTLAATATSGEQQLEDFDIGDIQLNLPRSYLRTVAPVSLTWSARQAPTDRYQVCLYDPYRLTNDGAPAQFCSPQIDPSRAALRFELTPQLLAAAAELGFSYGRTYHWYVAALQLNASGAVSEYGYSFAERALTIVPTPAMPAPSAVDLPAEPNLPPAATTPAEWTFLIYAAADNALGDSNRTPGKSRPELQISALGQLAAQHPQVRIVSFLDRYGDTGGQICYLSSPNGPDCREQPEPNSADPATLRDLSRRH
ncbi:MAG: hypothetical protein HC822_16885 [Oscillochloris sp.]|nr:hypothetical protein [Oscillochloris sp.]